MRRIALLGSTGSIGRQTLDVVKALPGRLQVVALAARSDYARLALQAKEFQADAVSIYDDVKRPELASMLPDLEVLSGAEGLECLASRPDVDIVVVAVAGSVGTRATIAALRSGKTVALATKEVLVAAGQLVRDAAVAGGGRILPIDSEHSALFQCLEGRKTSEVTKLWLTASGGPFRGYTRGQLEQVTAEDALKHPTWNMGPKITIDSATLMNKGLETIEAQWLFDIDVERIDVVVHPQSTIHSMVEFSDSSFLAQLGQPDMRIPIAYALLYPERADVGVPRLDPKAMTSLTFESPNNDLFPCLGLARDAIKVGGTMPAVLNATNEAAVSLFLKGAIKFNDIPRTIRMAMDVHIRNLIKSPSLDEIIDADQWARNFASSTAAII